MAWNEQQKEDARQELIRRRTHETATTLRNSFLNFAVSFVVCLWVMKHFLTGLSRIPHWTERLPHIYLACLCFTAAAVAGTIAYVRFLDWRRRVASDSIDSTLT
jgi:hypothetical protein